jgi:NAD(P)-dependent dehydrogenase (short-subunit alcohol dehydrogenase family)
MELGSMTALVTGAAGGIGHALSLGLLHDGANVVAIDIIEEGLKKLETEGAQIIVTDVSDPEQVELAIKQTVDRAGRLDILINNAGVAVFSEVADHTPDQFENVIRINLFGPLYAMRASIPIMREQRFGRIINVLSRNAEVGINGLSAYGASKAALLTLSRCTAVEVFEYNILVNGLIPGPTKTGMNPFGTQEADVVYPTVRMLALLPEGGPSGKVFWDEKEYVLFDPVNPTCNLFRRNPETRETELFETGEL